MNKQTQQIEILETAMDAIKNGDISLATLTALGLDELADYWVEVSDTHNVRII